jgi:molecular chaperone GrpE (heat shock protein)
VTSSNERFDENTRSATEVGEPQDTVTPDQSERLEETEASPILQDEPIEAQDADAAVDEPVDPERELADETPTDLVAELAAAKQDLAERTTDLQRLQAEYVNYRRRVERDRESVREQALANVLISLLPVLDDIGRARDHGELEGGFKAVADSLELIVQARVDPLRRAGGAVRPHGARGADAHLRRDGHRADRGDDPAAGLSDRAARRTPRSRGGGRAGRLKLTTDRFTRREMPERRGRR